MRRLFLLSTILCGLFCASFPGRTTAQSSARPIPKEVFAAKTIAIVNNTHNDGISAGALAALKRWGRFTLVDDSDTADIVVTFDKKSEHEKTSTQKTGDDGKPETSFGMSFSSSINMKAVMKGADAAFFTTSSSDSKKKAGDECVTKFQAALLAAR